ncbi:ATP-binding protein [Clostridium sp. OM07-10AC]|nr:ATP-binding protein [Clostridium sp. OM07-9AC]RHV04211.1 ATP-binding protein [Clostridium sp. OM07-10AC]
MIFIDEIESALHPKAVCQFLDMIDNIANEMGLQVFITSRSYFVIKKLLLIALKKANTVSCISLNKGQEVKICDLQDGMPDQLKDAENLNMRLILIVKNAEIAWLDPFRDKFRKELRKEMRIWKIPDFIILNEEQARKKQFIL